MGKLAPVPCHRCGGFMATAYPTLWHCESCVWPSTVGKVRRSLPKEIGAQLFIVSNVAQCLYPNYQKSHRLYYLRDALLAAGSPFRKFTYFWNGMRGNVDEYTDVMDCILRFL